MSLGLEFVLHCGTQCRLNRRIAYGLSWLRMLCAMICIADSCTAYSSTDMLYRCVLGIEEEITFNSSCPLRRRALEME